MKKLKWYHKTTKWAKGAVQAKTLWVELRRLWSCCGVSLKTVRTECQKPDRRTSNKRTMSIYHKDSSAGNRIEWTYRAGLWCQCVFRHNDGGSLQIDSGRSGWFGRHIRDEHLGCPYGVQYLEIKKSVKTVERWKRKYKKKPFPLLEHDRPM